MRPILAAAMTYRARGLSVIPFYRTRKAPALAEGEIHIYRARAAPTPRVRQWFVDDQLNIGVITGSRWRLLVLDVDGEEGRRSMRGLPNPPTPRVRTPRGYHAWFRYDGPPVQTRIKALPGVDLLADDWQVLAPPSGYRHGIYTWEELLQLGDLDLAPVPAWALDLLQTRVTELSTAPASASTRPEDQDREQGGQGILYTLSPLHDISQVFPLVTTGMLVDRSSQRVWTPDEISKLYRKPESALRCAAVLEQLVGRSLRLGRVGRPVRCILPGHTDTDREPSASFWWDLTSTARHVATGALVYRDFHREPVQGDYRSRRPPPDFTWLTLPEVRASLAYAEPRWLWEAETWVWQMRLLVEAGVVPLVPMRARSLPPGVRPAVYKVYAGFQWLLGCKWLLKPGEPTAFAWRFAAAWCGISKPDYVGEALTWLLRHGYLRRVGQYKRMALYQLGEEAWAAGLDIRNRE